MALLAGVTRAPRVARPPGPPPWQLPAALLRQDPLGFFVRTAASHPRLAHVRLGSEHLYVLDHPDLVWAVLVTQGRHTMKGRGLQRMRPVLGDGLLTSEGDVHRRQRRMIQPAFHANRMAAYADVMTDAAARTGSRWAALSAAGQRDVDVVAEMSRLTLDVVGRALFGADLRADTVTVGTALTALLENAQRTVLPGGQLLLRLPGRRSAGTWDALARLDVVVDRLIRARRERPPADDLLWALLAARDGGAAMSDRQVRDEVMTLLLAGHETTAMALSWAWYLLDRHPGVAGRLHDEVDALPDAPTHGDLGRLPWTTAVLAESMRLYPPAWIVGRRALGDLVLDGWTVPAGSLLVVPTAVLHRDSRWWPAADEMRPERWLDAAGRFDEAAVGVPRGAWVPFGAGSRVCVGERFAWTEGVLVLAALARHWRVRLQPGVVARPLPAVTLRPRDGLPATLVARSSEWRAATATL